MGECQPLPSRLRRPPGRRVLEKKHSSRYQIMTYMTDRRTPRMNAHTNGRMGRRRFNIGRGGALNDPPCQAVGQAAGLRALAPVGGAPAPGLAAEALPAVRYAERAGDQGLALVPFCSSSVTQCRRHVSLSRETRLPEFPRRCVACTSSYTGSRGCSCRDFSCVARALVTALLVTCKMRRGYTSDCIACSFRVRPCRARRPPPPRPCRRAQRRCRGC